MSNRRRIKPPKPKVCRQCLRGDHTGHQHRICPRCGGRLQNDADHRETIMGRWQCSAVLND